MKSPAPALARGLSVLRLLADVGPLSLDEAAKRTEIPKASALRLLRTLENEGLVARGDGSYAATARLVPLSGTPQVFDRAVEDALARLASATRRTAEWYVPAREALVLVKRAEPPGAELRVAARVGFQRHWKGELDAVAAVGIAAFRKGRGTFGGHWTYVRDGVRGEMSARSAGERVRRAERDGYVVDRVLNPNGVRRMACAVVGRDGSGVLALAGHFAPAKEGDSEHDLEVMLAEAGKLTAGRKTGT
jgi:DNA-binding IclR family transcriptional regulator